MNHKSFLIMAFIMLALSICGSAYSATSNTTNNSSNKTSVPTNSEYQTLAEHHKTHSIYNLENCGAAVNVSNNKFSVFGDYNSATQNVPLLQYITGWNHLTNGSNTEWKNIKLNATDYNNPTHGKTKNNCSNVDTLDMVVVKKIANWDHQHANGFESQILSETIGFGQVDSIIIDLKINSGRTHIPTEKQLIATYSRYTPENNITGLDNSKVNLGFTLYDNTNLGATDIIEIDQARYADKWIRVIINVNAMKFYTETNYVRTAKSPDDLANSIIKGLLVVGETKSGSVLRGKIGKWDDNIPETFKEMDVSIKKIEFVLK